MNAELYTNLNAALEELFGEGTTVTKRTGVSGGDRGFEAVGEIYSPTYYGIGVPRNQSAWRYRVNAALRSLIMDGTYQKIYDVWFGPEGRYPLPPASGRLPVWAE